MLFYTGSYNPKVFKRVTWLSRFIEVGGGWPRRTYWETAGIVERLAAAFIPSYLSI